MNAHPTPAVRRTSLSGDVVLVTGAETPLGAVIARRLAAEAGALLLATPQPAALRSLMADLHRIRALNRLETPPDVLFGNPETEEGAEAVVRTALQVHDAIDAIVHVGGGSEPLDRLLPLTRWGAASLAGGGGGRLVLCLGPGGGEDDFAEVVRAAASAYGEQEVCVNGVRVEATETAAERMLALAAGAPPSRPDAAFTAAAGLVGLLASTLGCGVRGQVFRLSGAPSREPVEPRLTDLFNRKVALR